jgi:hypothetical protein
MSDSCENHPYRVFLAEFSESEVKVTRFRRFRNLLGKYRLLIAFLRVIRPFDYDLLKYHFGPKMLEYGRKKLYVSHFPQLVFDMISPLSKFILSKKKITTSHVHFLSSHIRLFVQSESVLPNNFIQDRIEIDNFNFN